MLGRDEKMQLGFVDFPNFDQGFGFVSREAISEAMKFSKTHQVGLCQGCDTGVVIGVHMILQTKTLTVNPNRYLAGHVTLLC